MMPRQLGPSPHGTKSTKIQGSIAVALPHDLKAMSLSPICSPVPAMLSAWNICHRWARVCFIVIELILLMIMG